MTPSRAPATIVWAGTLACCLLSGALGGPAAQDGDLLAPGPARERAMAAGDTHRLTVLLDAQQHVRLVVEQDGVDVSLQVTSPAGADLARAEGPPAIVGVEQLAFITESTGAYHVQVRALDGFGDRGRYRIRLTDLRPATDADRAAVAAERLIVEGERLRMTASAANIRTGLERFEQALPLARQAGLASLEGDALTGIGRSRQDLRETANALEPFEQAIAKYAEAETPDREAATLNFLALARTTRAERPQAIALLERALVLSQRAHDVRTEALTLNNTGMAYYEGGEKDRALKYYTDALPLHRRAGNRRGEATTLTNIGTLNDSTGNRTVAIEYFKQALPLRRQIGDRRDIAVTLNNLGSVYRALDAYPEALACYREAIPAWHAAGDALGEGASLHNLAGVMSTLGDKQLAIDSYREALRLHRSVAYVTGEANILTNMGVLYSDLGDRARATAAYEEAVEKHRAAKNRAGESSTLVSLGLMWLERGEPARATTLLEQARTFAQQVTDPSREAAALTALARAQAAGGDLVRSVITYRQALDLHRKLNSKRGEAQTLLGLGRVETRQGDDAAALAHFESARDLYRAIAEPGGEAGALHRIAEAHLAAGRFQDALQEARTARTLAESLRHRVASAELRSTYLASFRAYYELEVDVLMRLHAAVPGDARDAEAFGVSERARARSLLEVLGEAGAEAGGIDPALVARERALAAAVSAKAERRTRLLSGRHTPEQAAAALGEVSAASRELDDVRAEMRAAGPRYAALNDIQPLALAAVRSEILDADTTLLEFMLGEERSYVWVVSAAGPFSAALPPRREIEAAARRFLDTLRDPAAGAQWEAAGRQLSDLVLGPVRDRLRTRRLVIAADGALQYVPFGALPMPVSGEPQPLIVEHEVISVPSASTIASLRRQGSRPPASRLLAVFADPVFSADDTRVDRAPRPAAGDAQGGQGAQAAQDRATDGAFARLIGSRREAAAILALAPAGTSWRALDFEASRATVLGPDLGQYRFVHFATHGFLDTAQPELSGLALSLVTRTGDRQNGFLRLPDIYNLRLGADLVVLSACQSALGRDIHGEGLIGLVRGFMSAGAPRVVASLWQVDDRATTELMTTMYRTLLANRPSTAAAALREAQLAVRSQARWRAPYYWAGFTLQGDWR